MTFIRKGKKQRSWWSKRFAWTPKKALRNDKPIWVWLESYVRYWNYGAIVNYIGIEVPQ